MLQGTLLSLSPKYNCFLQTSEIVVKRCQQIQSTKHSRHILGTSFSCYMYTHLKILRKTDKKFSFFKKPQRLTIFFCPLLNWQYVVNLSDKPCDYTEDSFQVMQLLAVCHDCFALTRTCSDPQAVNPQRFPVTTKQQVVNVFQTANRVKWNRSSLPLN